MSREQNSRMLRMFRDPAMPHGPNATLRQGAEFRAAKTQGWDKLEQRTERNGARNSRVGLRFEFAARGEPRSSFTMRNGYSDVNWFVRAVRVVPVIAGAALLGGMIGGFAMFAIDSALTWQPSSEPASQPQTRAENAASAETVQTNKQVRIVGGAIPDPSAGMSGPPPVQQQQQQRSTASAAQSQISSQLLTPKPLGPESQLQPQTATVSPAQASSAPQPPQLQTATTGPNSGAPQPQNQTANQTQAPIQAPPPATTATAPRQPTHWPDALSRAHKNATNTASAPAQTAPPATAQPSENANGKSSETDRKTANDGRAATAAASSATADDQDRGNSSRHSRHSRSHAIAGTNRSRNTDNNEAATAPSARRLDAPNYDRLYDSYGNRRERAYGNSREQVYGDDQNTNYGSRRDRAYGGGRGQSYGDTRYDQDDSASRSDEARSETRRYGRDTRYRGRSRVREQADQSDRSPAFEARQPRSEPFWGGGFFRRDGWGD
jgi:hypothetical protein